MKQFFMPSVANFQKLYYNIVSCILYSLDKSENDKMY